MCAWWPSAFSPSVEGGVVRTTVGSSQRLKNWQSGKGIAGNSLSLGL